MLDTVARTVISLRNGLSAGSRENRFGLLRDYAAKPPYETVKRLIAEHPDGSVWSGQRCRRMAGGAALLSLPATTTLEIVLAFLDAAKKLREQLAESVQVILDDFDTKTELLRPRPVPAQFPPGGNLRRGGKPGRSSGSGTGGRRQRQRGGHGAGRLSRQLGPPAIASVSNWVIRPRSAGA